MTVDYEGLDEFDRDLFSLVQQYFLERGRDIHRYQWLGFVEALHAYRTFRR